MVRDREARGPRVAHGKKAGGGVHGRCVGRRLGAVSTDGTRDREAEAARAQVLGRADNVL